ncbi:hypothetical protein NL676_008005 [Syzygium grande]|nr:hypothetical protein NL676_008005 [Syzygium grande]
MQPRKENSCTCNLETETRAAVIVIAYLRDGERRQHGWRGATIATAIATVRPDSWPAATVAPRQEDGAAWEGGRRRKEETNMGKRDDKENGKSACQESKSYMLICLFPIVR